jgi:hypothetical protein
MADSDQVLKAMFGNPNDGVYGGTIVNERNMRKKYWQKPSGEITIGPDWRTDSPKAVKYRDHKRYRELPDSFGLELINKGDITGHHAQGREHWWLKPFFEAGGLTYVCTESDFFYSRPGQYLITAEQLVTLGLHRLPEVKAARPDLAEAVDLECPYRCMAGDKRRLFSGLTEAIAQQSVDQHVVAAHKDAVASAAVGDAVAKAMKTVGGGDTSQIAAIVAAVVAALNPVQTAAVAAVAVGQPPVEEWADVPEPSGNPDETWTRARMFNWMKGQGMKFPDKFQSLKQAELLSYIRENTEEALGDTGESREG